MTNGNAPLDAGQQIRVGLQCIYGTTGTATSPCPDCNGAVNDTYFVEFINGSFAVYDRKANPQGRVTDREFWEKAGLEVPSVPLVDPRLVFIRNAGRNGQWLAVQLLNMGQAVYIATTDPNDPTADPRPGKWRASQFALPGADFPMLGYDANGVYIGSNTDAGGPRQPQIVTIPRAQALAFPPRLDGIKIGKPLPLADYGTNLFPAINGGGGAPVGIAIGVDTASKKHLTYACISPTSGEITTHGRIEIEPFEPISDGMGVKQPFTDNPASDVRFSSNGSVSAPTGDGSNIWMTHTVMKPGYSLGVRWYRLAIDQKSGLPALAAWGEISQPHYDYFNSSILSFGKDDYTVLSMSRSGDSTTPIDFNNDACGNIGVYAALVREKPGGQFQFQLAPLLSGMADNYIPGANTKRWGDYTTICWDPKLPRAVWTINQFVTQGGDSSEWRNAMVSFLVPPV